jgi:hypothetical protein
MNFLISMNQTQNTPLIILPIPSYFLGQLRFACNRGVLTLYTLLWSLESSNKSVETSIGGLQLELGEDDTIHIQGLRLEQLAIES